AHRVVRQANVGRKAPGRTAAGLVLACAADALARDRVGPRPRTSIHVLLIAPGLFQIGDERNRLVGGARTVRGNDLDPRGLDVPGHAFGIAADIDVRAVSEPSPQLPPHLAPTLLHLELLAASPRPSPPQ